MKKSRIPYHYDFFTGNKGRGEDGFTYTVGGFIFPIHIE
ncbi:unnamed protein product, partial [marine sediment metagenome]